MTNRFDINRSQRGIPAFSVLLIMAALAVIGVAMLPMLNVQYTPSPVERKIDVSFTWPDASARLIEQSVTSRIEGALSAITGSESVSLVQRKRSRHHSFPQGDGNGSSPVRSGVGDPEPLP